MDLQCATDHDENIDWSLAPKKIPVDFNLVIIPVIHINGRMFTSGARTDPSPPDWLLLVLRLKQFVLPAIPPFDISSSYEQPDAICDIIYAMYHVLTRFMYPVSNATM